MSKFKIILCIILGLFFLTQFLIAQDLPKTVYRADFRSPEEVFKDGFIAWGNDYDLMHHFWGHQVFDTQGIPIDGYISTTSDINYAYDFACMMRDPTVHARPGGEYHVYVYIIRADNNMYNVEASLNATANHLENIGNVEDANRTRRALRNFGSLGEWVARERIASDHIRQAIPLTITFPPNGGIGRITAVGTEINNPNYVQDDTHANDDLIVGNFGIQSNDVIQVVNAYDFGPNYINMNDYNCTFAMRTSSKAKELAVKRCATFGFSSLGIKLNKPYDTKNISTSIALPYEKYHVLMSPPSHPVHEEP